MRVPASGVPYVPRTVWCTTGRHGVLRAASNETLLVVYGPQHTMRYRTLLLACALGNVHALFLPLYHNLEAALVRLLRQQWPAGAAQPRVAVLARLALPR